MSSRKFYKRLPGEPFKSRHAILYNSFSRLRTILYKLDLYVPDTWQSSVISATDLEILWKQCQIYRKNKRQEKR